MIIFNVSNKIINSMRKIIAISIISAFLILACQQKNEDPVLENKVNELMSKMTLHEKIGQMSQYSYGGSLDSMPAEMIEMVRKGEIGSFLNTYKYEVSNKLQEIAITKTRLGIPLLIARDVIHGFHTMFPIPLGQAASWNPDLLEKAARISAIEASAEGIRWTFSPMLDVARDPRWGRIAETLGEDPYLISKLGCAVVRGYQGINLGDTTSLAACGKHYVGYGAAEAGKDYNTTWIPEVLLRDVYLVPFHAAVKSGLATMMSAFNDLNGVPASGNEFTLRQVLRNEWKFDGIVVSDYTAMLEMINHGYCADEKEVAFKAIRAGVDMEMVSTTYLKYLEQLVKEGKVSQKYIDNAVKNILRLKYRLGLFEHPYTSRTLRTANLNPKHLQVARELAIQSLVLLKNDGRLLPLGDRIKNIAIIGPLADSKEDAMGTNNADGITEDAITPLKAFSDNYGKLFNIRYAAGLGKSRSNDKSGFANAVMTAENSDVVVLFLGEEAILSGEAHSRAFIDLPGAQEDLVREIAKTGKPIVLVIMSGRPLVFNKISPLAKSIIFSFFPGTMGGPAIADVIMGEAEPSGKLPVSFPRAVGQIPIYYNHMNTGRPPTEKSRGIPTGTALDPVDFTSYHLDVDYTPEYAFGYGLAYTSFDYSELKLSKSIMGKKDSLEVSIDVSNTGPLNGTEVMQLYTRQLAGSLTQPVKILRAFKRQEIKAGEKLTVKFMLHATDLAVHNDKMQLVTESGKFYLWVGGSSDSGMKAEFEIK